MPIYEYLCQNCGEDFEVLQKFSDAPHTTCQCGEKERVVRKLSLSAFHLQGGGWYKDQYGSGKSAGNAATNLDTGKNGESKVGDSKNGDSKAAGSSEGGGKSDSSKSDGGGKSDSSKSDGGGKSDSSKSESSSKSASGTSPSTASVAASKPAPSGAPS